MYVCKVCYTAVGPGVALSKLVVMRGPQSDLPWSILCEIPVCGECRGLSLSDVRSRLRAQRSHVPYHMLGNLRVGVPGTPGQPAPVRATSTVVLGDSSK